jgi:hypothetical protein
MTEYASEINEGGIRTSTTYFRDKIVRALKVADYGGGKGV